VFVSYTRAFTDRLQDTFGSIFEESDQAQAIKAFQQIDRSFNLEKFMKEAREYIVPELMDAYLKGDTETLKAWCSEAVSTSMTLGGKVYCFILIVSHL
jgi:import inner membrane translocase subunit TIM44